MWIRRVAAMLLCAALCLTACGCQPESPYDKNFRLPLSGEPKQLDPQMCADDASRTVVLALFEGLTRLDDVGIPVAGAAASWEVSEDGLIYTFTLGDSRWSDGTAVTAADFVYGIRRAADPATRSPLAYLTKGIVNASAVIAGKKAPDTLGVTALEDEYGWQLPIHSFCIISPSRRLCPAARISLSAQARAMAWKRNMC